MFKAIKCSPEEKLTSVHRVKMKFLLLLKTKIYIWSKHEMEPIKKGAIFNGIRYF